MTQTGSTRSILPVNCAQRLPESRVPSDSQSAVITGSATHGIAATGYRFVHVHIHRQYSGRVSGLGGPSSRPRAVSTAAAEPSTALRW